MVRSIGGLIQVASYLGVCGYLIWVAIRRKEGEAVAAEEINRIVFLDFFGYFLLFLIIPVDGKSLRWEWPPSFSFVARVLGYGLCIAIFTFFFQHLAGWPLTLIWIWGIVTSLSDVESLKTGAVVRVFWAVISAFLAALGAVIAGVDEKEALVSNVPTILGWALLYFGGVVVFRILRMRAVA